MASCQCNCPLFVNAVSCAPSTACAKILGAPGHVRSEMYPHYMTGLVRCTCSPFSLWLCLWSARCTRRPQTFMCWYSYFVSYEITRISSENRKPTSHRSLYLSRNRMSVCEFGILCVNLFTTSKHRWCRHDEGATTFEERSIRLPIPNDCLPKISFEKFRIDCIRVPIFLWKICIQNSLRNPTNWFSITSIKWFIAMVVRNIAGQTIMWNTNKWHCIRFETKHNTMRSRITMQCYAIWYHLRTKPNVIQCASIPRNERTRSRFHKIIDGREFSPTICVLIPAIGVKSIQLI